MDFSSPIDPQQPLMPDEIFQQTEDDLFEQSEDNFFASFVADQDSNSWTVRPQAPVDPQIMRFDSFYLAIRYLSSNPFPISDLSNYAVVFPLKFWRSFPRSHSLDQVPCNIIKIQ